MFPNEDSTEQNTADDVGGGESVGAQVDVNLAEKDTSKAISRVTTSAETTQEADHTDDERPRGNNRLDRDIAKRIGRLQRGFDQRFAEQSAEHQREMREMKETVSKLQTRNQDPTDLSDFQSELQELEEQYAAALEAGESAKASRINTKIATKAAELQAARMRPTQSAQREQRTTETSQPQRGSGATPLAKRFISANADWWNDPDCKIERMAAIAIDDDLIQEGFDPNTAEHYEELKARMGDKFPTFDISLPGNRRRQAEQVDEENDEPPIRKQLAKKRPTSVSAGVNRGASPAVTNGRVRLTNDDFAQMRAYGLDPENDKHVRQWAEEKREVAGSRG